MSRGERLEEVAGARSLAARERCEIRALPEEARLHYDHPTSELTSVDSGPLSGLRHRTVVDARTGARELALWQEEHLPGFVVPLHLHDCEEIIAVIDGEIIATLADHWLHVGAQQSVLIPAGVPHGFEVVSTIPVRLHAIFGSARPGIFRLDGSRSEPPWEGGASDHLERDETTV